MESHAGSTEALEEALSEPTEQVVEVFRKLDGNVMVLGAAGKMGLSLCRMAKRAGEASGRPREIMAASRFSTPGREQEFQKQGIRTFRCDLLDESSVNQLPLFENIIYMPALKFGATGKEPLTWAMNTYLPSVVCRHFKNSRIVAFSTGNVYGPADVTGSGSLPTDELRPKGEYAMSCVGRERMFQYFSEKLGIPTCLVRLNYACEPRYGVLVDIAERVLADEPIDLSTGHFNTIWQGDANAMSLCCLEQTTIPAKVLNVTGPEKLSVRSVAEQFGQLFGKRVNFTGNESETALLGDASEAHALFGEPRITAEQLIIMVATWLQNGGATLGKPTHFETRDGKF